VGRADAGVDHVGGDTGTGPAVGELLVEGKEGLVDPVETPGGAGLGLVDGHGLIGLDPPDPRVGLDVAGRRPGEGGGVALEGVAVDVGHLGAVAPGMVGGDGGRVGHSVVEYHDVPVPRFPGRGTGRGRHPQAHEHDNQHTQPRSAHSPAPRSRQRDKSEVLAEAGQASPGNF
jgi:hypothetical protein